MKVSQNSPGTLRNPPRKLPKDYPEGADLWAYRAHSFSAEQKNTFFSGAYVGCSARRSGPLTSWTDLPLRRGFRRRGVGELQERRCAVRSWRAGTCWRWRLQALRALGALHAWAFGQVRGDESPETRFSQGAYELNSTAGVELNSTTGVELNSTTGVAQWCYWAQQNQKPESP